MSQITQALSTGASLPAEVASPYYYFFVFVILKQGTPPPIIEMKSPTTVHERQYTDVNSKAKTAFNLQILSRPSDAGADPNYPLPADLAGQRPMTGLAEIEIVIEKGDMRSIWDVSPQAIDDRLKELLRQPRYASALYYQLCCAKIY